LVIVLVGAVAMRSPLRSASPSSAVPLAFS
jgi:hypothetical protein